jgi:hypothetical protein
VSYADFIASKKDAASVRGFAALDMPGMLYPFQRRIVTDACERGCSAVFAECGLGKTGIQLAWAGQVARHTDGRVLVLAPLAVSGQTVREGAKFGVPVAYRKAGADVQASDRVVITNYERLKLFNPSDFAGIVLDESGILKSYSGVTKRAIVDAFASTPYRLACSATPAPNDTQELGNHSEFLGVMSNAGMLARWFITTFDAGKFRLKGHAVESFWRWVCSWAAMCSLPSDMGDYSDDGYVLPPLNLQSVTVEVDVVAGRGETLFRDPGLSATKIHAERRLTTRARVERVAELVRREPGEAWVLWTETDYEGDELSRALPEAGNLRGSLSLEAKEALLESFATGGTRILIAKPKMAGFGLNWQHCARMAFVASTYSFESYYQAVRRCWRFGQTRQVDCYMVAASTEAHVVDVLREKREEFETMRAAMLVYARESVAEVREKRVKYTGSKAAALPSWIGASK